MPLALQVGHGTVYFQKTSSGDMLYVTQSSSHCRGRTSGLFGGGNSSGLFGSSSSNELFGSNNSNIYSGITAYPAQEWDEILSITGADRDYPIPALQRAVDRVVAHALGANLIGSFKVLGHPCYSSRCCTSLRVDISAAAVNAIMSAVERQM